MRNAKYIAIGKRDKYALRIRLGMPVSSPSPVNTGRLAQVAADTVVRATKKVANKNPAERRGFFLLAASYSTAQNYPARLNAGCCRFLTLIQCGDRPTRQGRSRCFDQAHEAHQAGMAEQIRENETVSLSECANPAGSRRSTLVEPLEVPSIYKFGEENPLPLPRRRGRPTDPESASMIFEFLLLQNLPQLEYLSLRVG